MLREVELFGVMDKVADSIKLLQDVEPEEGYYLAFSGGKDSICIKEVCDMAGVKYDAHYNNTTIDPPELVRFIRRHHPDVKFEHPEVPFLKKMATKGFPQRQRRWCCEVYKERGGTGRKVVTGIRAAESAKRAGRKMVEACFKDTTKTYINPLLGWTDDDVWEFIKEREMPYCKLYDEGYKRLGCMFCPMNTKRMMDVESYPRYTRLFIKAFETLYATGRLSMINRWDSGEDMFWWWIDDKRPQEDPGQTVLFE